MHWQFYCPGCDHPLQGRPGDEDAWVRCPGCLVRFRAPSPDSAAVALPRRAGRSSAWTLRIGGAAVLLAAILVAGWIMWPARDKDRQGLVIAKGKAGGKGAFRRGALPRTIPPRPVDALIGIGTTDLLMGPDGKTAPLRRLGRIEPFLSLAFTSDGKLLASMHDGRLLLHDGRTFALLAEARLSGPAIHLALDEARGRLHACVSRTSPIAASRIGERETALVDLESYDVAALLGGKEERRGAMPPVKRLALGAQVASLALGRDGARLYYLAEWDRRAEAVVLEASSLTLVGRQDLPVGGSPELSLSPTGDRAYALASGRLRAFTPDLADEVGAVSVGGNVHTPLALAGGIVLLTERRLGTHVLAIEVRTRRLAARWSCPIEGRPTIQRSSDGSRAYLATSAVLSGRVWAIDCGNGVSSPVLAGEAASSPASLLRGAVHVSPDGRLVVLAGGVVLAGA